MRVLDDLFPYKHSLAKELYIKTADENYVVARGCSFYGLETDFFWLSAHCLEKYMKAALLLNEQSANEYVKNGKKTRYSHDIEKLYENTRHLAPENESWREETTAAFIHRLRKYGQPDNRYQFLGYVKEGQDLLKLDQVVFAIRRLCQPLEAHFAGRGNQKDKRLLDQTRRERMLYDDPASRNLYSTLEDVIQGKRGNTLRRILLNWNFSFAPTDYKHGRMRYDDFSIVNPVLVRRFLDPLDAGTPEGHKLADDLWSWAKENIQLPTDLIKLYEQERVYRKARAKK